MTWQYTPYTLVYSITTIISVVVALMALRRRAVPGGWALCLLMAAIALLSLGNALESAVVEAQAKIFWTKIFYLGAASSPVFFFLFTLEYTRQDTWLNRRNMILLWILPAITVIMAATNQYHSLLWNSYKPSPSDSRVLVYGHGPYFWVTVSYNYLLVLIGTLALVRAVVRSPHLYRRQAAFLLGAAVFPFIGSIVYVTGLSPIAGLDTTPISFSLTGIILTITILKYQLLDLVPIARDTLIENMRDGVLELDGKDRIVDINPVANKLLGLSSKDSIGQTAESVLNFWPEIKKCFQDNHETQTEVLLHQAPPLYLDLHISPLYDRHKRFTGRLLVFRDNTERRQAETELARNVEELKIINRISLAITAGLDMECLLKTLHEQCSQVAPIDIFYVALYDPSSSLINIPLYYDDGQYRAGASRDIHDRPGIIGNVIQARRTFYLQDNVKQVTRPLVRLESELEKPTKSYIGIPLTVRERIIGVMSIQSHRPNAYSEEQVRLLEQIAIQAAIAIENARLYAEEQRLAIIDELTNIYNYRGLMELGAREVERTRRFNHPLSALFFDIDNFHDFNNTYSHAIGNIVLQTVVQRCRAILRSVDIFARFGGDEFVALLPETNLASAEVVTRRLVEEIAATEITTSYGDLSVTISVGVTMLTSSMLDLAALLDRANQGERWAKQGQKSLVAIAP
jgi:diguanylate cyclase (GGDEF)-like protein/PAS domain S-box-containing protein